MRGASDMAENMFRDRAKETLRQGLVEMQLKVALSVPVTGLTNADADGAAAVEELVLAGSEAMADASEAEKTDDV